MSTASALTSNPLAIISMVISVLGVVAVYFGFIMKIREDMTTIKTQMEVFWKVLDPHLAGIIHSPTHKLRDALVDKLVAGDLTHEESVVLGGELRELLDTSDDADKKLAAALLLARVEWEVAKYGKRKK